MAVSLEDNRANIDSVLKQIPDMFANNRHGSPVGTAAVKACIEALKPHGGRVLARVLIPGRAGGGGAPAAAPAWPRPVCQRGDGGGGGGGRPDVAEAQAV